MRDRRVALCRRCGSEHRICEGVFTRLLVARRSSVCQSCDLHSTGVLDDDVSSERMLGIKAGFAWRAFAERTVVYYDLGVTNGMARGIQHATAQGHTVDYRLLQGWGMVA